VSGAGVWDDCAVEGWVGDGERKRGDVGFEYTNFGPHCGIDGADRPVRGGSIGHLRRWPPLSLPPGRACATPFPDFPFPTHTFRIPYTSFLGRSSGFWLARDVSIRGRRRSTWPTHTQKHIRRRNASTFPLSITLYRIAQQCPTLHCTYHIPTYTLMCLYVISSK
jgi:hypothetical protein